MKAVWRVYKRQIIGVAIVAAVLGYCLTAWGVWAARDPDEVTRVADVLRPILIYGTLGSVVLFVLIAGMALQRVVRDSETPDHSSKVICGDSDVFDEMWQEDRHHRQPITVQTGIMDEFFITPPPES